jgi:type IV secretory pathway VirJ component
VIPRIGSNPAAARQWVAPLNAAFDRLTARNPAKQVALPPAALGDLPVVEVPATPGAPATDTFAIIMSGDGGWAGLDEDVAAALAARGIPVVGLDSLRYYWTKRTPEGVAADTDKIIRYYLAHLSKSRVMLIGYSQGADVLPFAVNRLPPATRGKVSLAAVMGMSEHALFEFHLTSWVRDDNSGPETMPEMNRITGMPVLCIYGDEESDSLCPKLSPAKIKIVKLTGGHHFNGDYAGLAQQILSAAKR